MGHNVRWRNCSCLHSLPALVKGTEAVPNGSFVEKCLNFDLLEESQGDHSSQFLLEEEFQYHDRTYAISSISSHGTVTATPMDEMDGETLYYRTSLERSNLRDLINSYNL